MRVLIPNQNTMTEEGTTPEVATEATEEATTETPEVATEEVKEDEAEEATA